MAIRSACRNYYQSTCSKNPDAAVKRNDVESAKERPHAEEKAQDARP